MPGYLLIDGSNVAFAAASGQKLTVGGQDTQAVYGFLRMLRPLVATYSMLKPVVLWDGASWRHKVFPEYKGSRNAEPTTKEEVELRRIRESLKAQKALLEKALLLLGVAQVGAINMEADDIAAIMTRRFVAKGEKVILVSADKDWIQLIQPGVGWLNPIKGPHRVLTHATLPKRLGYRPGSTVFNAKTGKHQKVQAKVGLFEHDHSIEGFLAVPSARAWLEMKALMGDMSDEVPGVGGIGEKGALDLILQFGSVHSFLNRTIDSTLKDVPAKFLALADSPEKQELFERNLMLMDLNHPRVPTPINFTVTREPIAKPELQALLRDLQFKSILSDFAGWCEPFERIAA